MPAVESPQRTTAHIPEPYTGSVPVKVYGLSDVPSSADLTAVLESQGISTSSWGEGNTKDVSKFWKEIKLDEAGFEVWKKPTGETLPVRVTHVLRAKVSSPENYARGIFLFNTWQQYGDGRKRNRNGLLSEKLQMSEMPLEKNLHEVCQRAVTEEEMQRVCDASTIIGPDSPAPTYDPGYKCPLTVVDEVFVDHTVEIEASKSYPGLLTVYHLYTVDIICTGLPTLNFNTLEFDAPDKNGDRKLKYIHAWVWLKWDAIQRYLLEGSVMKERIQKDTFKNADQLREWLTAFAIDMDAGPAAGAGSLPLSKSMSGRVSNMSLLDGGGGSGSGGGGRARTVKDLFEEVQHEKACLEHWGRQDGVPILLRVVHVVQLQLSIPELLSESRWLFMESQQKWGGSPEIVNRPLARKVQSKSKFDHDFFQAAAQKTVEDYLSHIMDLHYYMDTSKPVPTPDNPNPPKLGQVEFNSYLYDIEESPTYKGLLTMYHLYNLNVVGEGLPNQDFSSLAFINPDRPEAIVWRWVTWPTTINMLHARSKRLSDRDEQRRTRLSDASKVCADTCSGLQGIVKQMSQNRKDPELTEIADLLTKLEKQVADPLAELSNEASGNSLNITDRLPPSMISSLAEQRNISDEFIRQAGKRRTLRVSMQMLPEWHDDDPEDAPGNGYQEAAAASSRADATWSNWMFTGRCTNPEMVSQDEIDNVPIPSAPAPRE
eukprot:TRINITY_DN33409_c0_g1_i1.p1 TRINITY_DN33409_c0_g1~~TRINITY_DN33409_c0_g1_i1.p1  ORF type:complete len:712 (-),score=118.54 TRINITY_DN33409_c0_g1_i1:136-2271(-)